VPATAALNHFTSCHRFGHYGHGRGQHGLKFTALAQSCQHCKIGSGSCLPFPSPSLSSSSILPLPFFPYPASPFFSLSSPSFPFLYLLPLPSLSPPSLLSLTLSLLPLLLLLNPARKSGERCKLPERVRAEPGRQMHSVRFEFKITHFRMSLSYTF